MKEKPRTIYKITNLIDGKCYIGQTKKYDHRIETHSKAKGKSFLYDAIRKYGVENFEFRKLLICEFDDVDYYEIECIKKYNALVPNGYNLQVGGNRSLPLNRFEKKLHGLMFDDETFELLKTQSELRKLSYSSYITQLILADEAKLNEGMYLTEDQKRQRYFRKLKDGEK